MIDLPPAEQASDLEGLADVLLGALGLTGIIVVGAVVFGVVVGGLIYLRNEIQRRRSEGSGESEGPGRVTR